MSEKSVLMVCHGNICRSTMAHQLLTQMVLQAPDGSPAKQITKIDSCGTSREELGNSPDPGTQKALKNHGYPPLDHRARQFNSSKDSKFDYILTMDDRNYRNVQRFLEGTGTTAKVAPLGSYDPQGQKVINDPWAGSDKVFENCYQHVYRSLQGFLKKEFAS